MITIVYTSNTGTFRVVRRKDTGYFYPQSQFLGDSLLDPMNQAWHYYYAAPRYDDRIYVSSVSLAMEYECNG